MPNQPPAVPRLVEVPIRTATDGDLACVHIGGGRYFLEIVQENQLPIDTVSVYRLTTDPPPPNDDAETLAAVRRLERWLEKSDRRLVVYKRRQISCSAYLIDEEFQPPLNAGEGSAPTLAAALNAALDAAGAEK